MPKTNRYKMTHRKRTLKRKNSKKHNNKQRGGDGNVYYSIRVSDLDRLRNPDGSDITKQVILPKKNNTHDLFYDWLTNNAVSLNRLFFNETNNYWYNPNNTIIYTTGKGTKESPIEVILEKN
jgi:hypothetical protein